MCWEGPRPGFGRAGEWTQEKTTPDSSYRIVKRSFLPLSVQCRVLRGIPFPRHHFAGERKWGSDGGWVAGFVLDLFAPGMSDGNRSHILQGICLGQTEKEGELAGGRVCEGLSGATG